MNISEFISGRWQQQYQYKSFLPEYINHPWIIDDDKIISLLSTANIKLGELNAFSLLIPDVDFFIKMHVSKEATTSSRIEGTQTNIEETLQKAENINPEKRNDWQEVHNYIAAMNFSVENLKNLPLSNRLIKQAHKILLEGVRGEYKLPGEFRTSQNWIGGSSLNDAVFIPPHKDEVPDLMSDLEKFLNNENLYIPDLIKIAIAHYQFETIHPFLDGNGRVGRLLITLFFVNKGILIKPSLFLSDFFDKNKSLYYENLMRVRTHNDLRQWLLFFLEGIRQTSENSMVIFRKIIDLRARLEQEEIVKLGKKARSAQQFLNYLYVQPVVESGDVAAALKINASTAHRMIDDFVKMNVLTEMTGNKRNRIFIFRNYVDLFK